MLCCRGFSGFSGAFQQSRRPVQNFETAKIPSTLPTAAVDRAISSDNASDRSAACRKDAMAGTQEGTNLETQNLTEAPNVPTNAAKRLYQGPGFMVDRARKGGAFVRSIVDTAFVKSGSKERRELTAETKHTHRSMPEIGSGQRMSATQFMRDMLDGAGKAGSMKSRGDIDESKEVAFRTYVDRQKSAQDVTSENCESPEVLASGDRQAAPESEGQSESAPHPGREGSSDVGSGKRNPSNYVYSVLESAVQRANISKIDIGEQDTAPKPPSSDKISEAKKYETGGSDDRSLTSASLKLQESSGSGRDKRPSQYMRAVFDSAILTAGSVVQTAGSVVLSAGETAGNVGREGSKYFKISKAEAKGSKIIEGDPAAGTWTSQALGNMRRVSVGSFGQGSMDGARKEGTTLGGNKEELVDNASVNNDGDSMSDGHGGDAGKQALPSSDKEVCIRVEESPYSTSKAAGSNLEHEPRYESDGGNEVNKYLSKRLETWLADD